MEDLLKRYVEEHRFVCALAATDKGAIIARAGDEGKLRWNDILTQYFGARETIVELFCSLKGGVLLPRVLGQGEVSCTVGMIFPGVIVAFFSQDERSTMTLYREVRAICEEMQGVLRGSSEDTIPNSGRNGG